jgi:hypothetical protein
MTAGVDPDEPPPGAGLVQERKRVTETPTASPTIGTVRELPDPVLGPAIGFRTPAVALDGTALGGYHIAAASIAGITHLVAGSVRQDAYDFIATVEGDLVAVVADGLGSKPHSQVGARLFCEGVLLASAGSGALSASELIAAGAAHASQVAAGTYRLTEDDISVVAAVAVFRGTGGEIARLGDASAFTLNSDGQFTEVFASDTTPINVVTASLPGASPEAVECATSSAAVTALVTDGLASDLRTSPALRSWLGEQWQAPLGPHAMGESLRYRRQGSHDDRTAVVVWADLSGEPGSGLPPEDQRLAH